MFVFGRRLVVFVLWGLACLPAASTAEVADVADNGFTSKNVVKVSAPPARAWTALLELPKWWDSEHTWSQTAANLSLEAKPQGCFCEKLPGGGGVRHMTVIFVDPGKLLRLEGGLGPFQALGISGVLTWSLKPAEAGSSVELNYIVSGYRPGGFQSLAPGADSVLRAQLERLKRYVETGKP